MKRRRYAMIVSDDIPADYLRLLLGNRVDRDAGIFSRPDAIRAAEDKRRRTATRRERRPYAAPERGDQE